MLGIKAQETILGTFKINGKEKIVCACKDFTSGGKVFYDFCSIKIRLSIQNITETVLNCLKFLKRLKSSNL